MHIEEYGLLEKKGAQLGVGTTKNGLGVLLYASLDDSNVFVVSSEKYKVVSTIAQDKILSSLDEGISIPDTLSEINGDVSFAALDQTDKTSIIARKNNGKIEVWKYNQFDGFGHILSSSGDFDPVVVDWYDDFSSSSNKLWNALDGYEELSIDIEGGVRRFKK
ncbi:MAG: hypothetical protein PUD65_00725 [Spirochaetales bacterium]|nr:hypothetical protein [Spirochaetales bacterium]